MNFSLCHIQLENTMNTIKVNLSISEHFKEKILSLPDIDEEKQIL